MRIKLSMQIAREEWRYWFRSRLVIVAGLCAIALIIVSLISTALRITTERTARESFQTNAEQTFRDQPARHPHRMVHYGHYVFRTPAPLALIDPGVDAHTGTILFLEGHRQNSAVFSPRYSSAQAGPFSEITPAFAYQVLVPLLLVIIGFASISRERENNTDYLLLASSVTPNELWLGKTLALVSVVVAALIPLTMVLIYASAQGESWVIGTTFLLGYAIYLICWVALVTAASAWAQRSTVSLSMLLASWVVLCVLAPRLASTAADIVVPLDGKIATDLAVTQALREVGDGHNANDPAFERLRAQLLEEYGVDDIEELPINFRGVVAEAAEADLTDIMNEFADAGMAQEMAQTKLVHHLSVLSPALALRYFSMQMAGTDLRQYHQFLRDAEALRFDFVQQLNQLHAHELAYADDINRSIDSASEQRTRVDAENWRLLKDFAWQPQKTTDRLITCVPQFIILLLWSAVATLLGIVGTQRKVKNAHG